jgi:(R)-2-hydroxyacyl-CoA dehydratese activating ATPase
VSVLAGIDVGTRVTKAVLVDDQGAILAKCCLPTGHDLAGAARKSLDQAVASLPDHPAASYVASTGFGRYQVPFRDVQITEITCHARGAVALAPDTRSVLDIGAMNARAIRVDGSGRVRAFRMNDKCASGAGRFLERVAKGLEMELSDIGPLSLRASSPQAISSICAVLAESEVINLVTQGHGVEDILAGTHESIAGRIAALLRQVGVEKEVALTGGVTKNVGMVRALERRLGIPVVVHADAEYAGALGAALLALRRVQMLGVRAGERGAVTSSVRGHGEPAAAPSVS